MIYPLKLYMQGYSDNKSSESIGEEKRPPIGIYKSGLCLTGWSLLAGLKYFLIIINSVTLIFEAQFNYNCFK